jgi:hypothetical protein
MAAVLELNPIPGAEQTPQPAEAAPPATKTIHDMVKDAIAAGADIGTLTGLYVKLRNAKKDIDEQAKAKTSPLVAGMETIEAHFLAEFQKLGVDSMKTEFGTPYSQAKSSVTVADNEAWVTWVLNKALEPLKQLTPEARDVIRQSMLDSGALAFLEARAAKSAVEAYLEETKELPPGLNRRVETVVNVRAS